MIITSRQSGAGLRAKRPDASWTVVPTVRVTPMITTTGSEFVINDAVWYNISSNRTTFNEAVLQPSTPVSASYQSLDPTAAQVDQNGVLTHVSNGFARIVVRCGPAVKSFTVEVLNFPYSLIVKTFDRWVANTLAKYASDSVESRIAGKTPSASTLNIYSAADHATGSYTRSATLWCADLHRKLTASCVWNSKWGQVACGTLITPQHMVGATHYNAWVEVGNVFRWVDEGNVTHTRTVVGVRAIPNADTTIALLDSPLPASIYPALIPPAGWTNRLGSLLSYNGPSTTGTPCVVRNQFGEARVLNLTGTEPPPPSVEERSLGFNPSVTHLSPWQRNLVPGDSGSSIFMEVGHANKFMLITLGGVSANMARSTWASHIAALDSSAGASTGLLPIVADLSAFPYFGPEPTVGFFDWATQWIYQTNVSLGGAVVSGWQANNLSFGINQPAGWDMYRNLTGLPVGAAYNVGIWIYLKTAVDFVIVVNNTQAWNTVGGAKFTPPLNTWFYASYNFTVPSTGAVNIHLGWNSETAPGLVQSVGTLAVGKWSLEPA